MKSCLILIIAFILITVSGCNSIVLSGSGKVGGVHGSGEVSIPIPEKAKQ